MNLGKALEKKINALSHEVVGAAVEVHKELGPGLLESAYEEALCHELALRKLAFERQKNVPVKYKGVNLSCGYRVDILIENKIVVELKAVKQIEPVFKAQLLTYLRQLDLLLGLLLNFNVPIMKQGIQRVVN